jgi:hypothetical protein
MYYTYDYMNDELLYCIAIYYHTEVEDLQSSSDLGLKLILTVLTPSVGWP